MYAVGSNLFMRVVKDCRTGHYPAFYSNRSSSKTETWRYGNHPECGQGSVIVVEGSVRPDMNTCGGIAATAACMNGLEGWVSDGLVRDVDEIVDLQFPMYCKGRTVLTARGRFMEAAINEPICCGGALCRFGDIVVGDKSGVVIIPQERVEEVTAKAEEIAAKKRRL